VIRRASWRPIIRILTSFSVAQAIMALVGLAPVVGFVVWLFERRHNDDFKGGAARASARASAGRP
jgi:hypothetical protein